MRIILLFMIYNKRLTFRPKTWTDCAGPFFSVAMVAETKQTQFRIGQNKEPSSVYNQDIIAIPTPWYIL